MSLPLKLASSVSPNAMPIWAFFIGLLVIAVVLAPLSLWTAITLGLLGAMWASQRLTKSGHHRLGLLVRVVAVLFYSWLIAEVALTAVKWVQGRSAGGRLPMGELWREDPLLTSRLIPGRHLRQHWEGVYDASIQIEANGWRRTADRPKAGPAWGLVGCSFTFGWGVSDDETVASALQRLRPTARIDNRAVPDHGTADARLILGEYLSSMNSEKDAIRGCIYLHIPEHFRRVALPLGSVAWDPNWFRRPRYELGHGNELVHRGKAGDARTPTERYLLGTLRQSRLLELLPLPWTPTPESLAVSTALVQAMQRDCDQAAVHFMVVLLPTDQARPPLVARWRDQLTQAGVKVFDAAARFTASVAESDRGAYFIPHDRHPRAKYHELMGRWLDAELMNLGW